MNSTALAPNNNPKRKILYIQYGFGSKTWTNKNTSLQKTEKDVNYDYEDTNREYRIREHNKAHEHCKPKKTGKWCQYI